MDDLYSLSPFEQSEEPMIQFQMDQNPYILCQQNTIQQDLFIDHASLESSNLVVTENIIENTQKLSAIQENDKSTDDHQQKKLRHRDSERKRRQQTTGLYASLRSLLPLEYIKGKRSTSDHTHEALKYIQHLQENLKELGIKRDKLKKFFHSSGVGPGNDHGSSSNSMTNIIKVSSCQEGVEIMIQIGLIDEVFPLSRVLQVLLDERFSVVSCVSTKLNGKSIHSIRSEANDLTYVDQSVLQQKLLDAINKESRFK
ncbi:unnamed protein product [Ilex paraguariensis]|uniref:BHLH domain-containing protein n=1 Tax=Ilex paraguariensis TaxID=185542 RepID=A0ABC8SV54_9AQUA